MENLVERCRDGSIPDSDVALVIATSSNSGGIARAERLDIPCIVISPKTHGSREAFGDAIFKAVREASCEYVCMGGFLAFLPIPESMMGRVINIHPALLPKFGGQGMYGHHVHEAVLAAGESESGCTVHFVDNEYDHGPLILQRRCPVLPDDDADRLADRVFAEECKAYPEALRRVLGGIVTCPAADA